MSQQHTPSIRRRTSSRRSKLVAALAVLGLAVVAAFATMSSSGGDGDYTVSYNRSSQILEFRAATFSGDEVDSRQLRGTPLVLNFYASWCAVCDRELPDFERVSQRLGDRVLVLGVNPQSNDTAAAQAEMIARNGVTYPTVPDPQDELLRQFNTTGGLPTTVFVDADGVVRKVHNGLLTEKMLLAEIASSFGVRG